ncbi:MAG: DUF202 domain-containing protein [Nitrospirota bacterium]
MSSEVYERLVRRGLLDRAGLHGIAREARTSGKRTGDVLIERGVPKYEVLLCLSHYYDLPFVEYEEDILVSFKVLELVDAERLKSALWFPVSVFEGKAEVIACNPRDPAVVEDIKRTLGVHDVQFTVALPEDLIRIIENNQDLNPDFPPSAGRTPLALVRTFLADRRTSLSRQRTALAKGRTGLSFLRTGIAFVTISIALYRFFGASYILLLALPLLTAGVAAVFDGFKWYFSARPIALQKLDYAQTGPTEGFTVLEVSNPGNAPEFARSRVVGGAEQLREDWADLSPVERRRFLANDRTEMAEERTALASMRTTMAKARTGLAFTRTGIAFAGLGIGLLRHFPASPWTVFDAALIAFGAIAAVESFHWYLPGRSAANEGLRAVRNALARESIWDFAFPRFYRSRDAYAGLGAVKACQSPSIWGTSGLALERTVLAERRNLMARLRTIMARSRTAMAFIRTGLSMSAVGIGLLIFFGVGSLPWTAFDAVLILTGLILVVNGLVWYFPAEKVKRQLPYCFGDLEMSIPDYGTSPRCWGKVVFSHDDI